MKQLAIVVAAMLAAYTAVSMALATGFSRMTVFELGPVGVSTFDIVFVACIGLLAAQNAFHLRPDPVPLNRLVLWLSFLYIGYQLIVVLPVAVLIHDIGPIDAFRQLQVRLGLVFVPFLYNVTLRYWRPAVLVTLFDIAAVGLVVWMLVRFSIYGPEGYWVGSVYRLRPIWGGAVFLFAWLLFTSFFYWPLRWWRVGLAMLGFVGIVLANHRSGFVALLVALTAQFVVLRGLARRVAIGLATLAAVAAVVLIAVPDVTANLEYSIATMFDPQADATAADRVVRSRLGLQYFAQQPFGDHIWNQRYYAVALKDDFVPHNFIVQLLVTEGIVPSLLMFAIIALTLGVAWMNRKDRLAAVMFAYMTFYLVMCLFNANFVLPENIALFFVTIALILDANRRLSLKAERDSTTGGHAEHGEKHLDQGSATTTDRSVRRRATWRQYSTQPSRPGGAAPRAWGAVDPPTNEALE